MKKITLWLFALFTCWQINAQVGIIQSFPNTTTPAGWTVGSGALSTTQACASASWRGNVYNSDAKILTSEAQVSNGQDLTISFDYKIVNWSAATVATNPFNGTITTEVSIDGGTTWTVQAGVINSTNHVASNTCTTKTYVVPGASVPNASSVKVRWNCVWGTSGDYYVYIDNISATQPTTTPPLCTTLSTPANNASNVTNSIISWAPASGIPTGYKLRVGSTSGGTDVLNNADVGNVLTYTLPQLESGTTYFVTVTPYNANGDATGCAETSFTTCDALFPDVTETFATFLPSCWLNMTGGDLVTGPTSTTGSGWVADGFANNGTTGAVRNEIWTTGANDWLISPLVTIPASGYELRFDAAATQYATSNAPTTAWEADDFIQVLVSTGFSNWTVLYTYDNTNQPGITATSNIINLDAYAGEDVRFAFRAVEGTANGNADIDFFIDNFNVRLTPASAPSCATNIVATPNATCGNFATVITWDAAVSADGYNIAIGTTPGTGNVFSGNLGNVLTYSFIGNIGTTYYYTIVPYNASGSATGCTEQSFTTNASGCYCVSAPTSVDGTGITNVQLVATNFANTVSTSPVYNDHTATVVDMSQGISNSVQITFNTDSFGTSYDYNTVIWIDVNDNFTFEPSEIVFTGVSAAVSPTILNASFVMPGTAPLGQHRMRIVATDALQTPANPCYSGAYGETADFTVNIVAASCTPPAATTTVVPACGTAQYSIDVNVTALGSGTPSITDGTTTWPVSAIGVVNVGPFASGSSVTLTLLHGSDATCNLPLGSFNYACPPANDDLCNAIPLVVNAISTGTQYNNIGATSETNEPIASCFEDGINGSVWFSFVAPASGEVIITTDIAGASATDTEIALYDATGVTCSDLSTLGAPIGCDQDGGTTIIYNSILVQAGLTPGTTYYIQVDDYGEGTDQGTFGIEVQEVLSSDLFDNNNFMAYPNPVKDVLNVSYSTEISSIRVINMIGQEVISKNINATSTQVDMSELSAGTYIVNVTLGDAVKTLKVVKQ